MPGQPPSLDTRLVEPGLVVAAFGSVHIVHYERDPVIETIDRAMSLQRRLYEEVQRPLSLVTLIRSGLSMPETEVRQHSARLMRDNAAWVTGAAIVAPESGLWTSAVMSVVAGLNILSRASIKLRMFTDRDKASAWTLRTGELPSEWQGPLSAALDELW